VRKKWIILLTFGLFAFSVYLAATQGTTSFLKNAEASAGIIMPASLSSVVYTGFRAEVALFFVKIFEVLMNFTGRDLILAIVLLALLVELVLLYPSVRIQLKQKKIHLFHKKLVDKFHRGELKYSQAQEEMHKLFSVNESMHHRGAVFVLIQATLFFFMFWGLNLMVNAPNLLEGYFSILNFNALSKPESAFLPILAALIYFLHALVKIYYKEREDYISPTQTMVAIIIALIAANIIFIAAGTFALALSLYFVTLITFSTLRYIMVEQNSVAWGKLAQKELIEMLRNAEPHHDRFEYFSRKWNHLPVVRTINFHLLEEAVSMTLGLVLALNFFGVFQVDEDLTAYLKASLPSVMADNHFVISDCDLYEESIVNEALVFSVADNTQAIAWIGSFVNEDGSLKTPEKHTSPRFSYTPLEKGLHRVYAQKGSLKDICEFQVIKEESGGQSLGYTPNHFPEDSYRVCEDIPGDPKEALACNRVSTSDLVDGQWNRRELDYSTPGMLSGVNFLSLTHNTAKTSEQLYNEIPVSCCLTYNHETETGLQSYQFQSIRPKVFNDVGSQLSVPLNDLSVLDTFFTEGALGCIQPDFNFICENTVDPIQCNEVDFCKWADGTCGFATALVCNQQVQDITDVTLACPLEKVITGQNLSLTTGNADQGSGFFDWDVEITDTNGITSDQNNDTNHSNEKIINFNVQGTYNVAVMDQYNHLNTSQICTIQASAPVALPGCPMEDFITGDTMLLSELETSGGEGKYTWQMAFGTDISIFSDETEAVIFKMPGDYVIDVTDANHPINTTVDSSASCLVHVNDPVRITCPESPITITKTANGDFTANGGSNNFLWTLVSATTGHVENTSNTPPNDFVFNTVDAYEVRVEDVIHFTDGNNAYVDTCSVEVQQPCSPEFGLYKEGKALITQAMGASRGVYGGAVYRFFIHHLFDANRYDFFINDASGLRYDRRDGEGYADFVFEGGTDAAGLSIAAKAVDTGVEEDFDVKCRTQDIIFEYKAPRPKARSPKVIHLGF
jgi:membrane protein insertase Oxa1/YidC/SpoIIIJ